MMKVLVNAYAVSPDRGSEPGMGWNWCVRLARECELFIITEGEFREGIERKLTVLPQAGNMHFYYLLALIRVGYKDKAKKHIVFTAACIVVEETSDDVIGG